MVLQLTFARVLFDQMLKPYLTGNGPASLKLSLLTRLSPIKHHLLPAVDY